MQTKEYDFFISYKRDDSVEIARQLADILKSFGRNVWLDEDSIQDNIPGDIGNGLSKAYCGIPILSQGCVKGGWTKKELNIMVTFEQAGELRIFPASYGMSAQEVMDNFPIIADKIIFAIDGNLKNLKQFASNINQSFLGLIHEESKKITLRSNSEVTAMTKANAESEDIFAIGIDVGTAYIDSGVVRFPSDDSKPPQIHNEKLVRTQWGGKDEANFLVEKICSAIVDISMQCFVQPSKISHIGVGLPGQVDPIEGMLLNAPALELGGLQISELVREKLIERSSDWSHNIKVFIDNDVTCSAVVEKVKGEGSGGRVKNFVCVAIGKGIGSGIVVDDRLYRGYNHNAGEVGHMVIDISDDARSCTCGSRGCFESYCSERGVLETSVKHIRQAKKNKSSSDLAKLPDDKDKLKPVSISAIISGTDPEIIALREELARHFAVGLSNIANMFNPKVIVITGGIGLGFFQHPAFLNDVQRLIKSYVLESNKVRIVQSRIKRESQIIGAAMLGITQL